MRVIADHLRAVTFLLADGAIPGNEGRGYVLRRILRRAVRHGMRLGFEEPFLHRLVPVLGEVMGEAYPELGATRESTVAAVRAEEEKFLSTVASGSKLMQEAVEEARRSGSKSLSGSRDLQALRHARGAAGRDAGDRRGGEVHSRRSRVRCCAG